MILNKYTLLTLFLILFSGCTTHQKKFVPTIPDHTRAELVILESTDVHSNVRSYDYYKLSEDSSLGFERLAMLVKQARAEFENTVLFDNGDTIQGTALADYQALVQPLPCNQKLAMYKAMDALGYDGANIGNHEFNYGLDFLSRATGVPFNVEGVTKQNCQGPTFPFVISNVFSALDNKPLFSPYKIFTKQITAYSPDGTTRKVPVRIGFIGFTPPPIMKWDKRNLEGKVYTIGVVEAANQFVPKMKAEGADIVIAISHGGIDPSPYSDTMENANWHLSKVPNIDAILLGHSHDIFPSPTNPKSRFNTMENVDNSRGNINNIPAVMGNFWGKNLGLIRLSLQFEENKWRVDHESSYSEVRSIKLSDGAYVAADPEIGKVIRAEHEATLNYVKTPIGQSDFRITSYFTETGDVSAVQIINMAQRDYVKKYISSNLPQYADLPLLSVAAAFKTGFGGANDYTDIPPGPIAIRNAADLYLYPNTLSAVKIDGKTVKSWLEKSAERFNQIDPDRQDPQPLINTKFPAYNFDVMQGDIRYLIDITQPVGNRIRELFYHGQPVQPEQKFIVVTNNYRASGGGVFPGLDGSNVILSAPDGNREVLIDYIRSHPHLTRAKIANDRSWQFAPVNTVGPITFISAADKLGIAHENGLTNISLFKDNADGTATYSVSLSKPEVKNP